MAAPKVTSWAGWVLAIALGALGGSLIGMEMWQSAHSCPWWVYVLSWAVTVPLIAAGWLWWDGQRGRVSVSAADLTAVLCEAEGFIGGKDNPAFSRLAAAVGVE